MIEWLLLPDSAARVFATDPTSVRRLVEEISERILAQDEHTENFARTYFPGVVVSAEQTSCFAIEQFQTVLVINAWKRVLAGDSDEKSFLAIPISRQRSSLFSYDEIDAAEMLGRCCELETRSIRNQPLAQGWHPVTIGSVKTVFAGGRSRIRDVRVAYESKRIKDNRVLVFGRPFRANRNRSVVVPDVDESLLEHSSPFPSPVFNSRASEARDSEAAAGDIRLPEGMETPEGVTSLSFREWIAKNGPLTAQQRRVLEMPVDRPVRIFGPAGSGKTLTLALKALSLVKAAIASGTPCRVVVVVTSDAIAKGVRATIEKIDEDSLLASSERDAQYLTVNTLHGWCIGVLNIDTAQRIVLERDPKASRQVQEALLGQAFDDVVPKTLKNLRERFSDDFRTRLDDAISSEIGKRSLLRELQYEFGIRIKGRGLRQDDRARYLDLAEHSFVGRRETREDRHLIFRIFEEYEGGLQRERLLDTDDVVLSASARLLSALWQRTRVDHGFDYVLVDEAHLFNDNERRLLTYLTRESGARGYLPLVMTFDDVQSIGGVRGEELSSVGIEGVQNRQLSVVHRCAPEILAFAQDIVERTDMAVSSRHIRTAVAASVGPGATAKPTITECRGDTRVVDRALSTAESLRRSLRRIGIICFDDRLYQDALQQAQQRRFVLVEVSERGEVGALLASTGVFVMSPESCGGLEFDAVLILGVDKGRVPPSEAGLSAEGYMSRESDAYRALYTAVTRAKSVLKFYCDEMRGLSAILALSQAAGFLEFEKGVDEPFGRPT